MFLLIILEIGAKVWYTFCTVVKYFVKSRRAGSNDAEFRVFILCFAANYKKGARRTALYKCMDMYDDDEVYEEDEGKLSVGKIIKKCFKWIAILIIVLVYAVIFVRLYFRGVPGDFKGFTWTDGAVAAFASDPENFEIIDIGLTEAIDDDGLYEISNAYICPSAGEVQLTVQYNSRSTINTLMQLYSLTERPTGEVFVYILRGDDGSVYTDYQFSAKSRPMNEFRRIIFTGVEFDPEVQYDVEVYYGGDVSEESLISRFFTLYDNEKDNLITKPDKAGSTKLSFSSQPAYINKLNEE